MNNTFKFSLAFSSPPSRITTRWLLTIDHHIVLWSIDSDFFSFPPTPCTFGVPLRLTLFDQSFPHCPQHHLLLNYNNLTVFHEWFVNLPQHHLVVNSKNPPTGYSWWTSAKCQWKFEDISYLMFALIAFINIYDT